MAWKDSFGEVDSFSEGRAVVKKYGKFVFEINTGNVESNEINYREIIQKII